MAAATLTPNFKWGQDKKHLFVTIEVADCKNAVVEIKETGIVFSYVSPARMNFLTFACVATRASQLVRPHSSILLLQRLYPGQVVRARLRAVQGDCRRGALE